MINIVIAAIAITVWIIIFICKPYCYIKSNFWSWFWQILFGLVGGIAGAFICQSIIYLGGGTPIIK